MKSCRNNELDKIVFVDGIGECVPVISAVSFGALAKLRVRVRRLRNAGLTPFGYPVVPEEYTMAAP